jgi:hypothetical protein
MQPTSNKEVAEHLRQWVKKNHGPFAWATDGCSYEQHMKFVDYRNQHWTGSQSDFKQFVLDYADLLDENDTG